jgi:hypothetical protein
MIVREANVFNLRGAITVGMRNPLESWGKSDSRISQLMLKGDKNFNEERFLLGEADKKLCQTLITAGKDHRKFMRQILVSMDINASMSAWWDIDTYKVASEKNSTSRMHKITSRSLTELDFDWVKMTPHREATLIHLNELISRIEYLDNMKRLSCSIKDMRQYDTEREELFDELIKDLPQGFTFWRHWTGNYEILRNIYFARRNHKQRELREFCKEIEKLPYFEELIGFGGLQVERG